MVAKASNIFSPRSLAEGRQAQNFLTDPRISSDSISVTSQLNLTTQLTQSHQTRSLTSTWQLSHMQVSRRPGYRPQHAEREDKEANCEPRRSTSQKTTDRSSLYAKNGRSKVRARL